MTKLTLFDFAVFGLYMAATLALGFWVARRGGNTTRGYFLGDKRIPWYVVGASMVATDISSEHFISNVGGAYKHGIVLAAGSWNAWIIYSLLIWIFLPYYIRTGIYTMPEFLERRYNTACRYIFAVFSSPVMSQRSSPAPSMPADSPWKAFLESVSVTA